MKYNELFKDILYKSVLDIIERFKGKKFKNQKESDLNEEATLIKVVIENYDQLYQKLNKGTKELTDAHGQRIELSPDFIISEVIKNNAFLLLETMFDYVSEKYEIPKEKIDKSEIDFDYIDKHFEEKDKLPFLHTLFIDAQLQYTHNLNLVSEYMNNDKNVQEMIDASYNVTWYHHAVFITCIWCEQYELSSLDYNTKKVRIKDAIQKIETFILESEFERCPEELLKEFDYIKRWLEIHSRNLEGLDEDTYNQKIADNMAEKSAKNQQPIKQIDYKEKYPDGFTFKDWEEGKILFFGLAFTQGVLTYEDHKKIEVAQKERYWNEVKGRLERRKNAFKLRYEKSEAKETLIDNAIKFYIWYFDIDQSRQNELNQYPLENSPITFLNETISKGQLKASRSFFLNYIVNGAQRNLEGVTNAKSPLEGMNSSIGSIHIESLLDFDIAYRFHLWLQNDFSNYPSQKAAPKKKIIKNENIEENIQTAISFLPFLSGVNHQGEKIMPDKDYDRLVEYVKHLIESEAIPEDIKQISQINTTNEYIRYTFYLIHKKLYTNKPKRDYFIEFIHQVFTQFSNTEHSTTKTKFSVKPPHYEETTVK